MRKIEIIAEIGQNFNGELSLAIELIHAAKENGADVAKFQLYDAKALFPKENNPWYDYNCKTELSRDDLRKLNEVCQKLRIEFMASVFDLERIEWLEEIDVLRYKIASRSIHDKSLIAKLCASKKTIIASLGMWRGDSFPLIPSIHPIQFLYCISKYPTPLSDVNFQSIDFEQYAGFSDHTIGNTAAIVAMSRGAGIIEKHFTLDKKMYGPDHASSMMPSELKELTQIKNEILEVL